MIFTFLHRVPRRPAVPRAPPNWVALAQLARTQAGYFTTSEAASRSVSVQTLRYHVQTGAIERVLRGVYRFTAAPPTDQDEFIALWLWTARVGVFSHATALWLHDLSDVMPARVHLTMPHAARYPRATRPQHVTLHAAPLADAHVAWVGYVPVTTPWRTIADCLAGRTPLDIVAQAIAEASLRQLISATEARRFRQAVRRKEQ